MTGNSIRLFINLEREYAMRWSPLNMSLVSPFLEIEAVDVVTVDTLTPNVVFDMPALSYALVVLDLRHLPLENFDWKYGDYWSISFTMDPKLRIGDLAKPTPMPEMFLNYR